MAEPIDNERLQELLRVEESATSVADLMMEWANRIGLSSSNIVLGCTEIVRRYIRADYIERRPTPLRVLPDLVKESTTETPKG